MRPILVAVARIDNLPKEADYRLSILRQAASAAASGSESSSRCAPLGAGEETSRTVPWNDLPADVVVCEGRLGRS